MKCAYAIGATPPVHTGAGALSGLSELIGDARDVLLVHDAGIAATNLPGRVCDALPGNVRVHPFVAPAGEPTVDTVNAAGRTARALKSPAVIGLGGGTALDIAKLAATLHTVDGGIEPFLLGAATLPGRSRLVAIPTTSGTGSEVTRTCILSNGAGRKLWVWADALMPDSVILDPELTAALPASLTLSTGLDAFAHALEACTGQARNRINEASALQAIRLAHDALERTVDEPSNLAARQQMQEAAILGGMAIDSGGTGVAHAVGHALGSLYHVPHGIAVALGLQATLRWSVAGQPERYQAAAAQFDKGLSAAGLADAFDAWLDRLDFGASLRAAMPQVPDARQLAETMQVDENQPMSRNNARAPRPDDIAMIAARTHEVWKWHGQQPQAISSVVSP